jgi:hypothetical protein
MHFLEPWTLLEISVELSLGVCIKLFCDNGRIHWRDFVNDYLFWLPGHAQLPSDGLSRHVVDAVPMPVAEEMPAALAAK